MLFVLCFMAGVLFLLCCGLSKVAGSSGSATSKRQSRHTAVAGTKSVEGSVRTHGEFYLGSDMSTK